MTLRNIGHSFVRDGADSVQVLDELDLDIGAGEIVAIMGPSGCGKSTLLNILAGQLCPTTGTVSSASSEGSPRISRVFQEPSLLPWRTVSENVALPLELLHDPNAPGARVTNALALASVADFANFSPRELSGGLASRVAIARALVTDPELILLDEPFGSLDEITAETVMFQLAEIVERLQATAVLVTHSVDQAVFLADRVIIMGAQPGRILSILQVEEPRPRRSAYLRNPDFLRTVAELRSLQRGNLS